MRYPLLALSFLLGVALAAPAASHVVPMRLTGQVTALNPPPTSGPFAGAAVGDPVLLELDLHHPGIPHPFDDSRVYLIDASRSFLRVGMRRDGILASGTASVTVTNDYLGLRDRLVLFNVPLVQGGLVRFELIDSTRAVIDTPDILLLRGTYPASSFTTTSFGAQVGGGFLELSVTELEIGNGGLGVVDCAPAVPNSTGWPALMQVVGSDRLIDDSLTLEARRLPPSTFGFFLTSRTAASVQSPGGSQGRLCLGGAIGRYQGATQSSGAAGMISLAVSPLALAQPTGPVSAQVGETWRFQAWFRDANPTSTSNFTDAVAVTLL